MSCGQRRFVRLQWPHAVTLSACIWKLRVNKAVDVLSACGIRLLWLDCLLMHKHLTRGVVSLRLMLLTQSCLLSGVLAPDATISADRFNGGVIEMMFASAARNHDIASGLSCRNVPVYLEIGLGQV